jgi:hypothetical protein
VSFSTASSSVLPPRSRPGQSAATATHRLPLVGSSTSTRSFNVTAHRNNASMTRYRDQNGQDWADIIDFLTMYPEVRRKILRLLGEIDASD